MGTHKHRDDRKRGKGSRGRGGAGSVGGSCAQGNDGTREYKKVIDTKIDAFLQSKKYSQAGFLATNIVFRTTPPDEIASVLLAGITALKEGKRQEWRPKAEDIARNAIDLSSNATKYQFSEENKAIVTQVLIKEIKRVAGGTS